MNGLLFNMLAERSRFLRQDDIAVVHVHVVALTLPQGVIGGEFHVVGTPAQPNAEPRPVVKKINCAPPAAWSVAETGS